jgi:hypothetical protein
MFEQMSKLEVFLVSSPISNSSIKIYYSILVEITNPQLFKTCRNVEIAILFFFNLEKLITFLSTETNICLFFIR